MHKLKPIHQTELTQLVVYIDNYLIALVYANFGDSVTAGTVTIKAVQWHFNLISIYSHIYSKNIIDISYVEACYGYMQYLSRASFIDVPE